MFSSFLNLMGGADDPVKRCCIPGCYSNTARQSEIKHLNFFKFPAGEANWTRRERWLNFLGLHYKNLQDSFTICSLHFCDNDFIYIPRKAMVPDITLKGNAFPHRNLDNRQDVACPVLFPKTVTLEIIKDAGTGEKDVVDVEVTLNSALDLGVVEVPRPRVYMDVEGGEGEVRAEVLPEIVPEETAPPLQVGTALIPLAADLTWNPGDPTEADLRKFRSQNARFRGIQSYFSDSDFYTSTCRLCFRSILGPCVRFSDPTQAEEVKRIKNNAKRLFPGIKLDFYPNPVVCMKCTTMLACSADLMETWQQTERKIYQAAKQFRNRLKTSKDLIVHSEATTEEDDFEALKSLLETGKPSAHNDHNYNKVRLGYREVTSRKATSNQPDKGSLCEICGKTFESPLSLKHHQYKYTRTVIERARVCEICGKVCMNSACFSTHLKSHNERNLACQECGKKFKTKRMVREHTKYKHLREALKSCTVCGERVASSNFKQHMANCTDTGEYPCTKCDKKFAYASCLKQHMRMHFKNYKCENCGAVTNRIKVFQKHVCDENLFCKICQEMFLQEKMLRRHVMSYHSSTLNERYAGSSSGEEEDGDESSDTE